MAKAKLSVICAVAVLSLALPAGLQGQANKPLQLIPELMRVELNQDITYNCSSACGETTVYVCAYLEHPLGTTFMQGPAELMTVVSNELVSRASQCAGSSNNITYTIRVTKNINGLLLFCAPNCSDYSGSLHPRPWLLDIGVSYSQILSQVYLLRSGEDANFTCSYPISESGAEGWCIADPGGNQNPIPKALADHRDEAYSYIRRNVDLPCVTNTNEQNCTLTLELLNVSKLYSGHVIYCANQCRDYFDAYNNRHIVLDVAESCHEDAERTCGLGFSGDGLACIDMDECAGDTDGCHEDADCRNTNGSYECTCRPGFSGNGFDCIDMDECMSCTNDCHCDAECTNTIGSYECMCRDGYSGNGFNCTDIDECVMGIGNCDENAECINTAGSFICTCNSGFSGDGFTCIIQSSMTTVTVTTTVYATATPMSPGPDICSSSSSVSTQLGTSLGFGSAGVFVVLCLVIIIVALSVYIHLLRRCLRAARARDANIASSKCTHK